MPGIAQSPSTRIVIRGHLLVRAGVLAVLGSLIFAASAFSAGTIEPSSTEAPPSGQGSQAGPFGPPITEPAPATPPTEVVKPPAPETPPVEAAKPPAPETPPVEAAKPPAPETPPVEAAKPPAPETPPVEIVKPPAPETPAVGAAPEQPGAATVEPVAPIADAPPPPPPPAAPAIPVASGPGPWLATVATPIGADPSNAAAAGGRHARATRTGETEARAGQGSAGPGGVSRCLLSGLGGPIAHNCFDSWPGAAAVAVAATPVLTAAPTLAPAADGSSSTQDSGGSAGGGRPVLPSPGPAPGGASGAAGGSGAGVGLSGFLTLAGLLLLAAPRAMRRLRLSCLPWRTAFFVLIPERPG